MSFLYADPLDVRHVVSPQDVDSCAVRQIECNDNRRDSPSAVPNSSFSQR
jgi:hypothetical protein